MESTLVKISATQDNTAEWVTLDHHGHPHAAIRSGSLSGVSGHNQHRPIIALVPSIDLVISEVGFPSKNRRKLRQAVPYILEDQFAEDVDDLHFAVGHFSQTGDEDSGVKVPVATIQQEKMQAWLEQFKACNLHPKTIIPDVLALPYEPNHWSLLIGQHTSLIRTGSNSGYACDNANLQILLDASLSSLDEATSPPEKLLVWDYSHNEANERYPLTCEIEVDYQTTDSDPISLLARGLRNNGKAQPLNLLQGEYSPQEEYGKIIRPWRSVAILLGSLILLSFIANLIELQQLNQKEQVLFSEMQNIYKTSFPDAKNLTRPKLFMQQKLKALGVDSNGNGSKFFSFLAAISETLPKHNATLKSISFNKQQLDIELEIANVQILDQLKNELVENYSLVVDINAATPQDNKIVGRLRIKEEASS